MRTSGDARGYTGPTSPVYRNAGVVMENLDRLLEDLQRSVHGDTSTRSYRPAPTYSENRDSGTYGRIEKRSAPAYDKSPSLSPTSAYYRTIGEIPSTHIARTQSPREMETNRRNMNDLEDLISDLDRAKSTTKSNKSVKSVIIKEESKRYESSNGFDRPDVDCVYEGKKSRGVDDMTELMDQMRGFKMNETPHDTGDYGRIKRPKSPAIKTSGMCCACGKAIVGQVVSALNKQWHIQCFTCARCHKELGTKNFFERDGKPYCEPDYHELFSPRCAYCGGAILDKCITALNKNWHPDHFFCVKCGSPFGEDGFHEKDGEAYCKEDFFRLFAPKCKGCSQPIHDNYISALNAQWHSECFVCRDCGLIFTGGSFFDYEGMPYCEIHYHAKRGSLCASCQKPITGKCITAMFQKFHPEHFVCSFCLKQLNKGTFKEDRNKPYCHSCFEKLH
ncbi:unnamed protein product [Cyprideis torosa]|uniref:Uncharacterized protein n=1 Tax=Cyprideis torosa TaxID=163714 RepID=A0A7R8WIM9_9CRUS|nr:unnamed protein product [Cyprideis torosa]CAG0900973.1 unnamed protein product [Cyprideis torosa]